MRKSGGRVRGGRPAGRLSAFLRQQLRGGRVPAGEFIPSVRELSAQHGVSTKTVQRSLRVLAAEGLIAAEPRLGYRVLARVNDAERACPLGVVLPAARPSWDPLQQRLVEKLQGVASRQGRSLLAVGAGRAPAEEVVRQLLAARAWGALLNVADEALVAQLKSAGMPAVMVETWRADLGIDAVVQDGFGGAMQAAAHLAGRAHERIGWLGYAPAGADPQIIERLSGALGGLARAGRRLADDLRVELPSDDAEAAAAAARRLLSRPDRPTAVLALWQPFVRAVAQAARELGLVPGRDFEMVGWWTEEDYETSYVPIFGGGPVPPAVTWSVSTMAETAMARIEERRARPDLAAVHIRIPARLQLAGQG